MLPPRGLETLFAALRDAKILVGPREVLRVHEVLSRAENLDREGLRSLLAAVLVKSREERQRFDEVFRTFVQAHDASVPSLDERGSKPPVPPSTNVGVDDKPKPFATVRHRSLRRTVVFVAGVLGALVGGAFVATWFVPKEPPERFSDAGVILDAAFDTALSTSLSDAGIEASTAEEMYPDAQDMQHPFGDEPIANQVTIAMEAPRVAPDERTFTTLVPSITIEKKNFWTSSSSLVTGLGILSMVLSVGAWLAVRHRKLLPPKAPAPTRDGPLELPLSAPTPRDLELLDVRSEDALIWGIGKFVTDDLTTNLDIKRTVLATVAAAGRPELRFEQRGRHRMVCIWIDESAQDPIIERFGRELSLALSRVGLEVEVARYWAVPDKLVRSDGTVFSPVSLEEELAFAIIAVMTDGKALSMRHAGADRKLGIAKLFRMLARMPRLAFVDFGEGASRVSRVAGAYGIAAVRPDEAAAFLAMGRMPNGRDGSSRKLSGDATAWAAACAFGMHPIDEETAFEVRRALGLSVSPWTWPIIRRAGRAAGDLIDWPLSKRAQLLDWLRRAERGSQGGFVDPTSLLGKTISYWKSRLDVEAAQRTKDDAITPWIGTPAERTLRIDRAILDLWDRPEDAARILYSFVGTDAERLVTERLRDYGSLEAEGLADVIVLPWHFEALPEATRSMFERIGFGGAASPRGDAREGDLVERRGRMWLGLGLACGLGVGAIVAGIKSWQAETFPCVVKNVSGCGGWCQEIEAGFGSREILGGLAGFWSRATVASSEQPSVVFSDQQVRCEEQNEKGWVIQRCGKEVPPAKPERLGDPRRSFYILQGKPQDDRIHSLGATLLDRRVADVVLVIAPPMNAVDINAWFPWFEPQHDRWVFIRTKEVGEVLPAANAGGTIKVLDLVSSRSTREMRVAEKPKQVWWNATGDKVLVLSDSDMVTEIDDVGNSVERTLVAPPSSKFAPIPLSTATKLPMYKGERSLTVPTLAGPRYWMAWSPDGESVILGFRTEILEGQKFGIENSKKEFVVPGGTPLGPVVWNPRGTQFAAISGAGSVVVWSAGNDDKPSEFPGTIALKPMSLAWSIYGNEILIGTETGVKMIAKSDSLISLSITDQPVSSIVGPVAGKYLVASAKAGKIFLVASSQEAQGAPAFEVLRETRALAGSISPDGQLIATVHEGGKIRVTTTEDVSVNEFECDTKDAPVWSIDGKRLLAICGDKIADFNVFPATFSIRMADGKCVSQDELVQFIGLRTSEAKFVFEKCEQGGEP